MIKPLWSRMTPSFLERVLPAVASGGVSVRGRIVPGIDGQKLLREGRAQGIRRLHGRIHAVVDEELLLASGLIDELTTVLKLGGPMANEALFLRYVAGASDRADGVLRVAEAQTAGGAAAHLHVRHGDNARTARFLERLKTGSFVPAYFRFTHNFAVEAARAWSLQLGDPAAARRALDVAMAGAARVPELAELACTWLALLADAAQAQACARRIERMAASSRDFAVLSMLRLSELGDEAGADAAGAEAVRRARSCEDHRYCSMMHCLFDVKAARRHLETAETLAGNARALIEIAEDWLNLLGDRKRSARVARQAASRTVEPEVLVRASVVDPSIRVAVEKRCSGSDSLLRLAAEFPSEATRFARIAETRMIGMGGWITAAAVHLGAGNAPDVRRCLEQAERRWVHSGDFTHLAHAWYAYAGDRDRAEACIRRAEKGTDAIDWLNAVPAWLEIGSVAEVRRCIESASASASDRIALEACAEAWALAAGDLEQCRTCLNREAAEPSFIPPFRPQFGVVLRAVVLGEPDDARRRLEAVKEDADDAPIQLLLHVFGDREAARRRVEAMESRATTPVDLARVAELWSERFDDPERALSLLKRATQACKDTAHDLAILWLNLFGDEKQAKALLRKAEKKVHHPNDFIRLAFTWREMLGDLKTARGLIARSARSAPDSSAHLDAARELHEHGDKAAARKAQAAALKGMPALEVLVEAARMTMAATGSTTAARRMLDKAAKKCAQRGELITIARAYREILGDDKQARRHAVAASKLGTEEFERDYSEGQLREIVGEK